MESALAYYRSLADPTHPETVQALRLLRQPQATPTLAVTGARDGCVDTEAYERVIDRRLYTHGLRIERLDSCGHFAHLEVPDTFNELLLQWLRWCA